MKKNEFGGSRVAAFCAVAAVAVASALTGCSDNDYDQPQMPGTQVDANLITYNVTGQKASRAASVFDSNNLPEQFYVSAWSVEPGQSLGRAYIMADLVKDSNPKGAHNWVDQSGLRYWPNNGAKLDFFATTASNGRFGQVETMYPHYSIPFVMNPDASAQADLLYARTRNQTRTATGLDGQTSQAVNLAFKHALSQIVFTAQCANPHLQVNIGSISLQGIAGEGTLEMAVLSDSAAVWQIKPNYTPAGVTADTNFDGAVVVNATKTDVTSAPSQSSAAMMVIPQTVTAANPAQADAWSGRQAYLKIGCIIYNVGHEDDGKTVEDTMIFGIQDGDMQNYDYLYIPISADWQAGKRYVYNLVFGQGNGGYRRDGSAAFIPVKYAATVDNWADGGTGSFTEPGIQ